MDRSRRIPAEGEREGKQKGRRRRRVKEGSSQLKERKSGRDNKEGFWHPGLIRPGALGQPQKPLR